MNIVKLTLCCKLFVPGQARPGHVMGHVLIPLNHGMSSTSVCARCATFCPGRSFSVGLAFIFLLPLKLILLLWKRFIFISCCPPPPWLASVSVENLFLFDRLLNDLTRCHRIWQQRKRGALNRIKAGKLSKKNEGSPRNWEFLSTTFTSTTLARVVRQCS